jgi:hypothetical protein
MSKATHTHLARYPADAKAIVRATALDPVNDCQQHTLMPLFARFGAKPWSLLFKFSPNDGSRKCFAPDFPGAAQHGIDEKSALGGIY